jgi:hypothetical protein
MSPLEIRVIVTRSISGSTVPSGTVEMDLVAGRSIFSRRLALGEPGASATGAFGEQDQCGQATKGVWGMSWRQEAKKGVEDCDKPGGMVKRVLIPGCPNQRPVNP